MKKIKEIVVVEGKTDTALLKELFEVDTIETHGLALDDKTMALIKEASKKRGIIVLTDPDFPGKKIRDQIQKEILEPQQNICPSLRSNISLSIANIFLPQASNLFEDKALSGIFQCT